MVEACEMDLGLVREAPREGRTQKAAGTCIVSAGVCGARAEHKASYGGNSEISLKITILLLLLSAILECTEGKVYSATCSRCSLNTTAHPAVHKGTDPCFYELAVRREQMRAAFEAALKARGCSAERLCVDPLTPAASFCKRGAQDTVQAHPRQSWSRAQPRRPRRAAPPPLPVASQPMSTPLAGKPTRYSHVSRPTPETQSLVQGEEGGGDLGQLGLAGAVRIWPLTPGRPCTSEPCSWTLLLLSHPP